MEFMIDQLKQQKPSSIAICAFLFKPGSFKRNYKIDYIGKEIGKKPPAVLEPEDGAPAELPDEEPEDTTGFFYSAKDEAQAIEDTEEMKRRMELIAEYEEKRFGTPFAEFDDDVRLPECDGNWDIMAEARPLDIDHCVDESVITSLQDELLEELIAAEQAAADAVEADESDTAEQEVLT